MQRHMSRLQKLRAKHVPLVPNILRNLSSLSFQKGERTTSIADAPQIQEFFELTFGQPILSGAIGQERKAHPLRIGVVLSGGQAAGGHNVICGLFDAIKALNTESQLIGFLSGPSGIVENQSKILEKDELSYYRNQGGFDLIGSGRTKIESPEQLRASLKTCQALRLDALVVIGGDDSNTNAAVLAEFFALEKVATCVIGVPKTIDGDLKNEHVATSFGFDSAAKTYSELIGNIARDALSAKKYTHFIRLMGRSASHITLECAFLTHPNLAIIAEEVAQKEMTLEMVSTQIADLIEARAKKGKNYGIILVPEGLIEFIPEVKELILQLNDLSVQEGRMTKEWAKEKLSGVALHCFSSLPSSIQDQLLLDRDPHGNVQVSMIETDKLLIETVKRELKKREFKGKFAPQSHFFGYEGRACFPSNFDAHYCYALGQTAALLASHGYSGYMACIGNLQNKTENWSIGGVPITSLMDMEKRKGVDKPVIQKALVDLKGPVFSAFAKERKSWEEDDFYCYPGPIQFFGNEELVDLVPISIQL